MHQHSYRQPVSTMSGSSSPLVALSPNTLQPMSRDSPLLSAAPLSKSTASTRQHQQRETGVIHRPFEDNDADGGTPAAVNVRPSAEHANIRFEILSSRDLAYQRLAQMSAFDCPPNAGDLHVGLLGLGDNQNRTAAAAGTAVDVGELIRRQVSTQHRHHHNAALLDDMPTPPHMTPAQCGSAPSTTRHFIYQQAQQHLQQLLLQQQQLLQQQGSDGAQRNTDTEVRQPVPGMLQRSAQVATDSSKCGNASHADEELDVLDDDVDELDSVCSSSRGDGRSPFSIMERRQQGINTDDISRQRNNDLMLDTSSQHHLQQLHQQPQQHPHHKAEQLCE